MKILREIVARCPKDNFCIGTNKCNNCAFRGRAWKTELKNKPYKYTIECEYKKENQA